MKKVITNSIKACCLLFCLIQGQIVNSQPVLTPEDITPLPGETFMMNYMEYTWIDAENSGGENVVWDFTDLEVTNSYEMICIEVMGTPYESYFENAEYCLLTNYSSPSYNYFSIENNFLNEEGYGSLDAVETSYDPISWAHFPITYLDSYIDTISTVYFTFSGDTFRTDNGICHCSVDGYGTLLLPDVVYEDVVRIRCIDTITIIIGSDTVELKSNKILWYMQGFHHYILLLGGNTSYSAYYFSSTSNDASNNITSNISVVYPNPFRDYMNIDIPFFFKEAVIEIMDVNGNKVFNDIIVSPKYKTNLEFLPPGFYYAKIIVNSEIYEYKLVKI